MHYICTMNRTAFIFDDVCISPDRQIGMHTHVRWELSCVLCGSGTRTIGNFTEPIEQGEIILIPPHIPHVWEFDSTATDDHGNISNISVFFEPQLISSMSELFPELAVSLEKIKSLTHPLSYFGDTNTRIFNLLISMRGLSPEQRLPKMIELLTVISDTSESRHAGKNVPATRIEQRLEKLRIYCACNYMNPITLDEISRHVGMNRSAFCTFMRRNTGMSLSEYVNNVRLEHVKEKLLNTDSTISEIALDCGFQNIAYFNRLFRERYHCTPKSTRTNNSVP